MGTYVYSITARAIDTKIGLVFHPSKYSHKPVFKGWGKPPTWEIQKESKLEKSLELLQSPGKWSGYVGIRVEGGSDDSYGATNGSVWRICKVEVPCSHWYDSKDPGEVVGHIQKCGSKWVRVGYDYRNNKVFNEDRETLLPYFEKVQNKENWKNPIRSVVSQDEIYQVIAAIKFFTGSESETEVVEGKGILVVANGYYEAVGV